MSPLARRLVRCKVGAGGASLLPARRLHRRELTVNDTTRSDDVSIHAAVNGDDNTAKHITSVKPISEWGPACATGFVRDSRFGSGQVIKGTNRVRSRANRRLVDWQGAK
jgi:hypothetical protein